MAVTRPWMVGTVGVVMLVTLGCLLAFYIPETCLTCRKDKSQSCYRAAVLDHRQQVNTKGDDKQADIELNLQVFENAAKLAKQNAADIVVFPENGIIFHLKTREETTKLGETIPNEKGVPMCTDEYSTKTPIVHRLACMAKNNNIMVVADVIDVQLCTNSSEVKCPADNLYAFNTAVLFDRNGKIIAKYHKMHPFGEMTFNVPLEDDLVVVDTEIGRLSLQVCFDMIYAKPGVYLASQGKIDTMLFPTWWFDELPFLAASQYQMAWALGNKINLLGSNIHRVEVGSKGSGIYAGGQGQFEVISEVDAKSRLLVASLPVRPSSKAHCPLNALTLEVKQLVPVPSNIQYRYQSMNLTQTEVLKVDLTKTAATKCAQGVCCSLRYQVNASPESTATPEEYYMIVANRTRPGVYPWTEEFCALVHCPYLKDLSACSLISSNSPLQTTFSYVEVKAELSNEAVIYPSVIGSEHKVLQKGQLWSYSEDKSTAKSTQTFVLTFGSRSSSEKSYSLSTIGLYGRVYSRDPPYVQRPTGGIL